MADVVITSGSTVVLTVRQPAPVVLVAVPGIAGPAGPPGAPGVSIAPPVIDCGTAATTTGA